MSVRVCLTLMAFSRRAAGHARDPNFDGLVTRLEGKSPYKYEASTGKSPTVKRLVLWTICRVLCKSSLYLLFMSSVYET